MRQIKPLHDKVLAIMIDGYGDITTDGGLIIRERDGETNSIRPRWFKVVAVGPEQEDVCAGDKILVAHGRWSRGLDVDKTGLDADRIFLIDNDEIFGVDDDS
jgi:co-chaperonin GroES (HSP10)